MNKPVEILLYVFPGNEDIPLPSYATGGSAGLDLRAAIKESVVLDPGKRALIPTGIAIALSLGYEAQVRPRSGLAINHGIMLVNSPGTIDSDYRGEIKVIIYNSGANPFEIKRGDRIAQMVINRYEKCAVKIVDELPSSSRGDGGFGHTGSL